MSLMKLTPKQQEWINQAYLAAEKAAIRDRQQIDNQADFNSRVEYYMSQFCGTPEERRERAAAYVRRKFGWGGGAE
jgi:hypothetical protein